VAVTAQIEHARPELDLPVLQIGHRRDQYKRCANLLEAVSQLLEHFSHYQDVPKIQTLTMRLSAVQVRGTALPVHGSQHAVECMYLLPRHKEQQTLSCSPSTCCLAQAVVCGECRADTAVC
jgi:hypothetical protein